MDLEGGETGAEYGGVLIRTVRNDHILYDNLLTDRNRQIASLIKMAMVKLIFKREGVNSWSVGFKFGYPSSFERQRL